MQRSNNTFKNVSFRIAQTGLSVDELKAAAKLLARMDLTDVSETGNAIAARVREVGTGLLAAAGRAQTYGEFGLPLPDIYKSAEALCKKATTVKDPTAAVKDFLAHGEEWVQLFKFVRALDGFLADKRDKVFEQARRIFGLCEKQPVPPDRAEAADIQRALEDANAVVRERAILEKWAAFRDAYHGALERYRAAYQHVYASVADEVLALRQAITSSNIYSEAPSDKRDNVIERYFDNGGALCMPKVSVGTADELLASCAQHSLTELHGILVGLPGWRSTIEAELLQLRQPGKEPSPPQAADRTFEWRPLVEFGGRRFGPDQSSDLELELNKTKDRLKRKLAEGFTVVVR